MRVRLMELLFEISALVKRKPQKGNKKLLSHRACKVISVLDTEGSMNQRALAAKLKIRPQSLIGVLNKLESEGYIERSEDKNNKKANIISLTNEGKAEAEIAKERIVKHSSSFFENLTDDEVEKLIELLEKVINKNTQNSEENE